MVMVAIISRVVLWVVSDGCYDKIMLFSTDIDDLYEVSSELIPVAGRWKTLGLALRLHPNTIRELRKIKIM